MSTSESYSHTRESCTASVEATFAFFSFGFGTSASGSSDRFLFVTATVAFPEVDFSDGLFASLGSTVPFTIFRAKQSSASWFFCPYRLHPPSFLCSSHSSLGTPFAANIMLAHFLVVGVLSVFSFFAGWFCCQFLEGLSWLPLSLLRDFPGFSGAFSVFAGWFFGGSFLECSALLIAFLFSKISAAASNAWNMASFSTGISPF